MQAQKIAFTLAALLLISVSPIFISVAHAMTPTLSLSTANQTGDYVQVNVTGDANSSVILFDGLSSMFLGTLTSSGTGSFTVGAAQSENQTILIAANSPVYVKTGGINGTSSATAIWPYTQNSSSTGTLTLSQGALLLNAGQTSTITANANYLYVLSNSSPAIANINLNANQITVAANTYGSTVADICVVGSTTNCANLTVTVQNSSAQQLTFSQNNFSIVSGQNAYVTVSGGTGYYTISNNSNSTAIQSSLNGSTVTLTASNSTGSASITVCTTDMNYCGIINVSATASNSTAVTFSQTNPVVAIGQSTTVTIYGGSGNNFYVSSNSNPSIVQANINSNILTLIGNSATGSSNISICAYAGSCGSLVANVSSTASSTGGPIALSQTTISILVGQSSNITISGGSTPYNISAPSTSNIFNGVVSGNILTIYGVNPGSANINVCASIGCTTLYVTISNTTSSINPPSFSQNNILLNVGQQLTVSVSGTGSYYISNNSNSTIASEQISGNSINVSALAVGTSNVSICQSGGQCATLYITVSPSTTNSTLQIILSQNSLSLTPGQNMNVYITGSGSYYIGSNSTPSVASVQINGSSVAVSAIGYGTDSISICQSAGQCASLSVSVATTTPIVTTPATTTFTFTRYLFSGMNGEDVLQLQKILVSEKLLSATPNGHFGPATLAAVKKFQKKNGLSQVGATGPATRNLLNKILTSSQD